MTLDFLFQDELSSGKYFKTIHPAAIAPIIDPRNKSSRNDAVDPLTYHKVNDIAGLRQLGWNSDIK